MLPFHLRGTANRLEKQPTSHLEVQSLPRIAQVVDLIIGRPASMIAWNIFTFKINELHDLKGSNAQSEIAE
jgi:hypothetical protein